MLDLIFTPEQKTPELIKASEEYEHIWNRDGKRIIETLEKTAEMHFSENLKEIKIIVYEGYSFVKWHNSKDKKELEFIKMRASYPAEIKKGTLIHELGHVLLLDLHGFKHEELFIGMERVLFLILFDVWKKLYGKEFADNQVAVESGRIGIFNYKEAWSWALSLSREKRMGLLKTIKEVSLSGNK